MFLYTKLLILVGILATVNFSVVEAEGSDEMDDNLRQALFLVGLLKSDFGQIMRSQPKDGGNSSLINSSAETEDVNSTCTTSSADFNTTMPMNDTEGVSVIASGDIAPTSTPYTVPALPPIPENFATPPGVAMMPYSNWPPMPVPYPVPPAAARQGNFMDESYRFPYRFNRRRMMPDYYYFDPPVKNPANFRRLNNADPTVNVGTSASLQVPTAPNISPATSEATAPESATAPTTNLTMIAQPSTSSQPTYVQSTIQEVQSTPQIANYSTVQIPNQLTSEAKNQSNLRLANPSILQVADPTIQTPDQSPLQTADSSVLPTVVQSVLKSVNQSTLMKSTIQAAHNRPLSRPKKRIRRVSKRPETVFKGTSMSIKHHHIITNDKPLRQQKPLEDATLLSQIASELEEEIKGTNTNISNILNDDNKQEMQDSKKNRTTTMKIFLKGSTRLAIPFSENNAFCHFHPNNPLCGTNL